MPGASPFGLLTHTAPASPSHRLCSGALRPTAVGGVAMRSSADSHPGLFVFLGSKFPIKKKGLKIMLPLFVPDAASAHSLPLRLRVSELSRRRTGLQRLSSCVCTGSETRESISHVLVSNWADSCADWNLCWRIGRRWAVTSASAVLKLF